MSGPVEALVVGVGNVLHGDDGFGIALAHRLQAREQLPASCKVIETGIGGMSLIQEVMAGCQRLLILDAYRKGEAPGTLYLLEPQLPDLASLDPHARRAYFADTHYATPARALSLLQHLQRLPETVHVLGCEPHELDDLHWGLSPAVHSALERAELMVCNWLAHRDVHAAPVG